MKAILKAAKAVVETVDKAQDATHSIFTPEFAQTILDARDELYETANEVGLVQAAETYVKNTEARALKVKDWVADLFLMNDMRKVKKAAH